MTRLTHTQRLKRFKFIETAVAALQKCANDCGYKIISKETLSLLLQEYNRKYRPPRFPQKIRKTRLALVKVPEENSDK